jgi:hypothetical protein
VQWRAILLIVVACGWGKVHAQDFQIGGDEQHETVVPLEFRPSLGLFVIGYVNGHGPYRFSLGLAGQTFMTSTVVKEAGLATRGKGLTFDLASNQFEQSQQLTDATLRLGDKELSIDGAQVIPDDDLGAYVPVPHYGGVLGVEVFRRGIVRIDLTHAQLVLSARADTAHASDAIELPLEQNAADAQLDRLPIVPLALDGQSGKFRIIFSHVGGFFGSLATWPHSARPVASPRHYPAVDTERNRPVAGR